MSAPVRRGGAYVIGRDGLEPDLNDRAMKKRVEAAKKPAAKPAPKPAADKAAGDTDTGAAAKAGARKEG